MWLIVVPPVPYLTRVHVRTVVVQPFYEETAIPEKGGKPDRSYFAPGALGGSWCQLGSILEGRQSAGSLTVSVVNRLLSFR